MQSWKFTAWVLIAAIGLTAACACADEETKSTSGEKLVPAPPVEGDPGNGDKPAEPVKKEGQSEAKGEGKGEQQPQQKKDFWGQYGMIILMVGGMILLFSFMGRGRCKQEDRRREMLSSLKKGNKITTIGGIVGTVIELREDEVTVKVDETNNIRMRFARWSIRGVGDSAKSDPPPGQK